MNLDQVTPIANDLLELLRPACEEIQIAGSVRRQKPDVHDLEFVLLPKRDEDLFGNATMGTSQLDSILTDLDLNTNTLVPDQEVKRYGPKLKRLIFRPINLVVELYIADERNFGNLLTIRTGCWEFSRGIMTSREKGGQMPMGMRQIDGYLWETPEYKEHRIVPCRTEESYFAALGLDWTEPEKRTPELAAKLWGRRAQ